MEREEKEGGVERERRPRKKRGGGRKRRWGGRKARVEKSERGGAK